MARYFLSILILTTAFTVESKPEQSLTLTAIRLAPYGYIKNNTHEGIFVDILDAIAKEMKIKKYKVDTLNFPRLLKGINSGEIHMTLLYKNPKISKGVVVLAPVYQSRNVIFARAGDNYQSFKALHRRTIAAVRSGHYDDALIKEKLIRIYETKDYAQNIKMLVHKRLDGMVGPEVGLLWKANELGYRKSVFSKPFVLNNKFSWLHVSKNITTPEFLQRLKVAVEKVKKKIPLIKAKYLK